MHRILIPLLFVLLLPQSLGAACALPDNGNGTVDLPPNCQPEGFRGSLQIADGLPLGTSMELDASIADFTSTQAVGGVLGGTIETFTATVLLEVTGSGDLDGFQRTLVFPVDGELHVAPHPAGATSFDITVYRLRGKLQNDYDFALLEFEGGDVYGLDSPGETTLTSDGNGGFLVEAFFDYNYRIQWEGMRDSLWLDGGRGISLDLEAAFVLASGVTAAGESTQATTLLRAFPNPSTGTVTLLVSGGPTPDAVAIFDARGRLVRQLDPGRGVGLRWDGSDDAGRPLASGVYFARTIGPTAPATTRWVLRR